MKKLLLIFLFISAYLSTFDEVMCQEIAPEKYNSYSKLSEEQFKETVLQFDDSISALTQRLEKSKAEKEALTTEIASLENRISVLRNDDQNNTNVFSEIRLKNLLNELKEDLEKNANLLHQWDLKQKEFEQKALSLITLYNDRIEMELSAVNGEMQTADLQIKFNRIAQLIQKRDKTQAILAKYPKKATEVKSAPILSFDSLKIDDRESLQLALGLIQDRKKELEEKIQKESVVEEEVKNEMTLQSKMQEFLDGIKRMNEDVDFPSQDSRKNDFGSIAGVHQKRILESRLMEVQNSISSDRLNLSRLDQLDTRIQNNSDAPKRGDSR